MHPNCSPVPPAMSNCAVSDLRVEDMRRPIGIGTRHPRFSWKVVLPGRARRQMAYHIQAATTMSQLIGGQPDLWDSGRVDASDSIYLAYGGTPLRSHQIVYWRVRIWDEKNHGYDWSEPAVFETGLLDESDWVARWIGLGPPDEPVCDPAVFQQNRVPPQIAVLEPDPRAPLMRRRFAVNRKVKRARLYVCGLGLYEARLDGQKVGQNVLVPSRTEFRKRVLVDVYDVTALLTPGEHVLGLILGNGWFNPQRKYWGWQMQWYGSPRALLQLEIEFEDGSRERICSDAQWRGAWSPITFNCLYDGEEYDARLEQSGWDAPGFDDSDWQAVNLVADPGGRRVMSAHEPGRIVEEIRPMLVGEPAPGVFVFDMGKNITGWVRVRLRNGRRGERIQLRYAEALEESGWLDRRTQGEARQEDHYVMKGADTEMYEPRFTYHGFQYVEVTGYPGVPDPEDVIGCFVRSAVEEIGFLGCGHPLINRIHRCTVQSQRCNLQMGVPTDDTQRAERQGWGADAWACAEAAFYNFRIGRFYAKWIADFCDQQDVSGFVGMIVPQAGPEEDLVWSAAFILIPWWQYVHTGDRRILEEAYPYLRRYMAYLEATGRRTVASMSTDALLAALRWRCPAERRTPTPEERGYFQIAQWGDHLATHEGGSDMRRNQPISNATAFFFYDAKVMSQIARVLGKEEDAQSFAELAKQIQTAFHERFYSPADGYYDNGCQSAQAWALAFGLTPQNERQRVEHYLCHSVEQRQQHLTTGYVGTKWVIRALSECGRDDLVWRCATATTYPSWGYMLRDPKRTTITENWAGGGSLCHTALGAAIEEWFYWGLAGIRPDEKEPGYAHILFSPFIPPDLLWVEAAVETARGRIASRWRHDGQQVWWTIEVPPNSRATVRVPTARPDAIFESDVPALQAVGVCLEGVGKNAVYLAVGSGEYMFKFPLDSSDGSPSLLP